MTIYSETFNTNYYTDTLVLVISIVIFKLLVIVFKRKAGEISKKITRHLERGW